MKELPLMDPTGSSTYSEDVERSHHLMSNLAASRLMGVVLWCREEPGRVGEVLDFPPHRHRSPWIFGRHDPLDSAPRVELMRQRPRELRPPDPLNLVRLSRQQLAITVLDQKGAVHGTALASETSPELSLEVINLGKRALLHQGLRVDKAIVHAGEVLELAGELLFLCVKRPGRWAEWPEWLHYPPFPFGEADAFGIVGESPAIWTLRRGIALAAHSPEHTLILGARGTGKEAVARAIHLCSSRAKNAYVTCDVSAIPEDYVSTELFGNCAGFPVGARSREGLVTRADGGTLLLDELGDLPRDAARDLRRFLQEGEYRPLGASTLRRANVRVMGATNCPTDALPADVADRFLRRIQVPPLSERLEDVPLIAHHFLTLRIEKDARLKEHFLGHPPEVDGRGKEGARTSPALVTAFLEEALSGANVRGIQALLSRAIDDALCHPRQLVLNVPARAVEGRGSGLVAPPSLQAQDSAAMPGPHPGGPGPASHFTFEDERVLNLLRSYRFEIKRAAMDPLWGVSEATAHKMQRVLMYKALLRCDCGPEQSARYLAGSDVSPATEALRVKLQKRLQLRLDTLKSWFTEGGQALAQQRLRDQDGSDCTWGERVLAQMRSPAPKTC